MTLSDINFIVNRIAAVLQSGGPSSAERDLADQYAGACHKTNERLLQCARMIDEGSSNQALMLAEQRPNLLDAVAALGFARSAEWQEACKLNGLNPAPKLDRSAVHKLNELYNKSSKSDQTKALYKEFRGAMAVRNESAALDIIRAIAQLDPSDTDAAKQLVLLERKRREDASKALKEALAAQDEGSILSWLEQCEKLDATATPEAAEARKVRARVLAREAKKEVAAIVPTLAGLRAEGQWQQCGQRASRVDSLAATHGFTLAPSEASAVADALSYFESRRAEAMHEARFREAVADVSDCADRIQTRTGKTSLENLEDARLELKKTFEKAKDFAMTIPESLVARITQIASSLDSEIARLRKARKIRNVSLASVAALVLLALAAGGYYVLRAGQFAGELRSLTAENKSLALRQFVSQVREQYPVYMRFPAVKAALLEAEAWLEGVAAQKKAAHDAIAEASSLAEAGFSGCRPEEASAVFQRAAQALDKLPKDLAETMEPELSAPGGKLALWLGGKRDERIGTAKTELEQARQQAAAVAEAETGDALRQVLPSFQKTVGSLLELAETPVNEMRLPEAMGAEISDLASKVEHYVAVLQAYDATLAGLVACSTVEEYAQALTKLGEVQLPKSPMVKAAQQFVARKLGTHELLGAMILPAAPAVWAAAKSPQDLSQVPFPDKTRETEVDRLSDLINNENLSGIYEATLQDRDGPASASSGRKIFTRGKLDTSEEKSAVGHRYTRASGMVYDPALSGGRLNFQQQSFVYTYSPGTGTQSGKRVDGAKESAASTAMQQFGLKQLVSGDRSQYLRSILETIDKVKASREAPPLAKAYVLQELAKIANARPNEWGLAWVPSLAADLEHIKKEAGGTIDSGDWMVPAKAQAGERLSSWFKQRLGFSYASQQILMRRLAQAAAEAGLVVCGYVGPNGELVRNKSQISGGINDLWGIDVATGKPAVLFTRDANASGDSFSPAARGVILSPVFASPVAGDAALATAYRGAQIPADSVAMYAAGLPPIFSASPPARTPVTQ